MIIIVGEDQRVFVNELLNCIPYIYSFFMDTLIFYILSCNKKLTKMNSQASEPTIVEVIRMLEQYEKRNNAEVQQLRRDVEQANDNYNRLHANVAEYRGDISTSKLDIDGLKKSLEVLNTDIRGVREDYNGIHQ